MIEGRCEASCPSFGFVEVDVNAAYNIDLNHISSNLPVSNKVCMLDDNSNTEETPHEIYVSPTTSGQNLGT